MAKYEAIVELKYLSEKDSKKANIKKLVKEAKEQLGRYLKDTRLELPQLYDNCGIWN